MTRRLRLVIVALAGMAALEAAVIGFSVWRARQARTAADTPVVRGATLASRMGCFACHGPGGAAPIPNPGSKSGQVPAWTGGTWMMWNKTESDVRGWIADGHPAGRPADASALIKMPAYRTYLSDSQLEDLVAYVLAVSQFGPPASDAVGAGQEAAFRLGCFGCHGPEGRGLRLNPGSLKGFIPPWDGPDYPDLVRDDAEFRQWVRNGVSDRFKANPAARVVLSRQAVEMPAFGDRVTDDDLKALAAYVAWVRATPRTGASAR
jgi:mono/diheme cytochrome c family protein